MILQKYLGGIVVPFILLWQVPLSYAGTEGTVSGKVTDSMGVGLAEGQVELFKRAGHVPVISSHVIETGEFFLFPVEAGDYTLVGKAKNFSPTEVEVHVVSGENSQVHLQLTSSGGPAEIVLEVKAKKREISRSSTSGRTEINQSQIQKLPQGSEVSLPKLLTSTAPGAVAGAFGQVFFRGNHANIQYQIDGVQMPESGSNTFGQAFSPRNIDRMEVITGGVPAEYGQRLGAIVNIFTKSGPETPGGEVELNYGSYRTFSPHLLYGGSTDSGNLHYFLSLNYRRTDRGLDTPQPESLQNQTQGGTDAIHDVANANNEFIKLDWYADNRNKLSLVMFNAINNFQIPNYPSSFSVTSPLFQVGVPDEFGNDREEPIQYRPATTNDTQYERNSYIQLIWKRTVSERSFFQLAPYFKNSAIKVDNDLQNDLYTAEDGAHPVEGANPISLRMDRHINNLGLKGDLSFRPGNGNQHLVKTGFQLQASHSDGFVSIQKTIAGPPAIDSTPNTGYFEGIYLQDDITLAKPLIFNLGLRYDATQFNLGDASPRDSMLQPRVGVNYFFTDTTKLHAFYGKLFQPAPLENLRVTFNSAEARPGVYDIKAEKDDYYEVGLTQQLFESHTGAVTAYYKDGVNVLDDAQLFNTAIAQPFNFAQGYSYGVEFSVKGQIDSNWSEYLNYAYNISKGKGISGGAWAGDTPESNGYQTMDHTQKHTANLGLSYSKDHYWSSVQGVFGSGLRTGPANSKGLPAHFTLDLTAGYEFSKESWLSKSKVSVDLLNVFNNVYPITIANEFTQSQYAAGRQIFLRLTKFL